MKNKQTIIIVSIIVALVVVLALLLLLYDQPEYVEGEVAIYSGDTLVASYSVAQLVDSFDIIQIDAVLDTSNSIATDVVFSGVMLSDIFDACDISNIGSIVAYAEDGYVSSYALSNIDSLALVYMLDGENLTSEGTFKGPFAIIDTSSAFSQYWCQCVVTIVV